MSTAELHRSQELFLLAFQTARDPRSVEYKAGVLAALQFRLGETKQVPCPYAIGTAQADAWHSGTDEGHRRGREYLEGQA